MPRKALRIKRSLLALAILFGIQSPGLGEEVDGLNPAKTHAVIVGVLHWQAASVTTFAVESRKDLELYQTLTDLGVPRENMALLLDEKATLDGIRQAIKSVSSKAKEGDTLIFYYAGHGTSVDGNACLYNYDVDPSEKNGTMLTSQDISNILKANFHGDRVLMFADCCYSGALAKAAEELAKNGIESATLTSASDAVTSTGNWTFTYLLIELLRGNPDGDLNNDGTITLAEAAKEVADAMKFRENQPSGDSRFGISADYRLSSAAKPRSQVKVPEPYQLFEYVQVQRDGRWVPARIVDFRDGSYSAEIQNYATREIASVDPEKLRKYQEPKPRPRPKPLPLRAALAKARVDGKYANLLEIFEAESDRQLYSRFHDFGHYPATSYAGQADLPAGYWVYVYPNWYIWKDKVE